MKTMLALLTLLALSGMAHADNDSSLYAGVGVGMFNVKIDEDPVYGVGIGLTLFDRLATKLEYEYIDISGLDESDALWLTAAWRF